MTAEQSEFGPVMKYEYAVANYRHHVDLVFKVFSALGSTVLAIVALGYISEGASIIVPSEVALGFVFIAIAALVVGTGVVHVLARPLVDQLDADLARCAAELSMESMQSTLPLRWSLRLFGSVYFVLGMMLLGLGIRLVV